MIAPPPPSPPDGLAAAEEAVFGEAAALARAGRRMQRLEELAAIGMGVARAVGRRAGAAADQPGEADQPDGGAADDAGEDLALAFSRAARAVRLTLALEARLEADWRAGEAERAQRRDEAARAAAHGRMLRGLVQRDKVEAAARRAIARAGRERADPLEGERLAERLEGELEDLLEDEGVDVEAFCDRPVAELAAAVCGALGVRFDPALWTEADDLAAEWDLAPDDDEPTDDEPTEDGPPEDEPPDGGPQGHAPRDGEGPAAAGHNAPALADSRGERIPAFAGWPARRSLGP